MFGFFLDMGNYEERKVARFENENGLLVSTARLKLSFHRGLRRKDYNGR